MRKAENPWSRITVLFLYFCAFYFRGTSSLEGTGPEGILGHYTLNIGVSKTCQLWEPPGCLVKIFISGVHILDQWNQAFRKGLRIWVFNKHSRRFSRWETSARDEQFLKGSFGQNICFTNNAYLLLTWGTNEQNVPLKTQVFCTWCLDEFKH